MSDASSDVTSDLRSVRDVHDGTGLMEGRETMAGTKHRKPDDSSAVPADELLGTSPFDGDLATELAARPPRRVRPGLTLYLGAGVLVVAGFIGGVQAQQRWGPQPVANADALRQAVANRFGGGGAPSGQNGGQNNGARQGGSGAGTGNVTFGTVKLVDGKTVYLQTASGGVVQIKTDAATKVQISKNGAVKDLKPGSTVIVQGTPGAAGTVSATSINEGSLPAGRGFGGAGGGGTGGGRN